MKTILLLITFISMITTVQAQTPETNKKASSSITPAGATTTSMATS